MPTFYFFRIQSEVFHTVAVRHHPTWTVQVLVGTVPIGWTGLSELRFVSFHARFYHGAIILSVAFSRIDFCYSTFMNSEADLNCICHFVHTLLSSHIFCMVLNTMALPS
jgi:hypothetical protein